MYMGVFDKQPVDWSLYEAQLFLCFCRFQFIFSMLYSFKCSSVSYNVNVY